jgi:serine/threonine-protein kinase
MLGRVMLGPYTLLEVLGRGGMGVVHRALHRPTGAVRAVKVLDGAPDAEAVDRFRREAAALARAQGEGVVPVHDVGVADGRLYFGMPLLEGGSLAQRLARSGPLTWRAAAALGLDLARALARCHEVGLIHRDLKPANVLFDQEGRPHLADFGCVRDVSAARLTQTGTLVGTPLYMAPELFGHSAADGRADVYSLGAVLYEAVAGHAPHQAAAAIQVLNLAMNQQRAPLQGVPRAFEEVVDAALAPDPARRIASAAELAARLAALLEAKDGGRPRRRPWVAVGAVAALGAAILGASLLAPPAPEVSPAVVAAPAPVAAPVDPYAAAREVLRREHEQLAALRSALEQALPAEPGPVDRELAAAIVSATAPWRQDEPLLASVVFAQAARVDPFVAQPPGLASQLLTDSLALSGQPEAATDHVVALMRLGRRTLVVGGPVMETLEGRLERGRGGWTERLALSTAILDLVGSAKKRGDKQLHAELRARGFELALIDERGVPRAAVAVARFLQLEHGQDVLSRADALARLDGLLEVAEDMDCPAVALVCGAEVALDRKALAAARPFMELAAQASFQRVGAARDPPRPWAPPLELHRDPAQLIRLRLMLDLLDGRQADLSELAPKTREGLAGMLAHVERPDLAARVRAYSGEAPR